MGSQVSCGLGLYINNGNNKMASLPVDVDCFGARLVVWFASPAFLTFVANVCQVQDLNMPGCIFSKGYKVLCSR